MREIRLLLVSLPGMLSEIIRHAVETEPDLRILDERGTLEELEEAVRRTEPDVLVVGAEEGELPRECARLMYDRPHPRTLSISADGRRTSAYRLRPHGVRIENVSPEGIVDAIRELSLPPVERAE